MIALIVAVFVASLLGSMHCAGMCGAFVAFAVAADEQRAPSRTALNLAYNLGRLVTYTLLGAICGTLGAVVDVGGTMVGVQRTAAIIAGAMMVIFGGGAIFRAIGMRIPGVAIPRFMQIALAAGHRKAFALPPLARATAIGLLTTLLPCGWLYAFAITAAGTASPLGGAITMAAFWLGTLPMMMSLGIGLQHLTGSLRKRLPVVTSAMIVVVGVYTIVGRLHAPVFAASQTIATSANLIQSIERVESLDSSTMPCCRAH